MLSVEYYTHIRNTTPNMAVKIPGVLQSISGTSRQAEERKNVNVARAAGETSRRTLTHQFIWLCVSHKIIHKPFSHKATEIFTNPQIRYCPSINIGGCEVKPLRKCQKLQYLEPPLENSHRKKKKKKEKTNKQIEYEFLFTHMLTQESLNLPQVH